MDNKELNKLEALAKAATPQNFDTAQITNQGCIECPSCDGSGEVELTADYCNYDGRALGVQFYGIGPEHRAAEAFYRAANPAAILELIALARRSLPVDAAGVKTWQERAQEGTSYARGKHFTAYENAMLAEIADLRAALARAGSAAPAAAEGPSLPEDLADVIGAKCAEVKALVGDPWGHRPTDAQRYERLQILGAAPGGSKQLESGTVLRFQNLDDFVDADIAAHPSRGEFKGDVPLDVVAEEVDVMSQAARDVLAERRRQIETEGWTPEHDDMHNDGQMAAAAGYYALACAYPHERDIGGGHVPTYWPWAPSWWKPRDVRSNLVRAGALILAEVERLDRAAQPKDTTDTKEKANG